LNVKQQAAIGQVLACPKCGSMVQVTPPDGWQPPLSDHPVKAKPKPPRNAHDSQATVSGELGNLNARGLPQVAKPKAIRNAERSASANVAATPQINTTNSSTSTRPLNAPPIQKSVDLETTDNWSADGSAQRSNARLWMAGIIGICLVALVLILYMFNSLLGGSNESEPTNQTAATNQDASNQDASNQDASNQPTEDPKRNNPADQPAANDKRPTEKDPQVDNLNDSDGKQPASTGSGQPTESAQTTESQSDEPIDETDTPPAVVDPPSTDTSEEPILDPVAALTPGQSGDPLTMKPEAVQESTLDKFKGVGELVFESELDMERLRDAASIDQTRKIGIGKVFVPVPPPLKVDPAEELREVYLGLAFKEQTLLEFTKNLFQLTQVPFQLDGQSIADGRLDPFAKVDVVGKDLTVEQVLERALPPLNLQWHWNADQTVVIFSPVESEEIVASAIELDPVLAVTNAESAEPLMKELVSVILPESWNAKGGPGTIKFEDGKLLIEQTPAVTRQVESVLQMLESAASLKRSGGDPMMAKSLMTPFSTNADLLGSEGTVDLIQREPFFQVARRLQEDDGITLVPDWDQLIDKAWNPNVEITWHPQGDSLGETLRDLTNSMEITFRNLGPGLVQLTSRESFSNDTRIHVYPCGKQTDKKFTGSQIIQLLKEGIAADLPLQHFTQVDYLPQYDCIVALLPEPLHIRVEKILDQMVTDQ